MMEIVMDQAIVAEGVEYMTFTEEAVVCFLFEIYEFTFN